MSKRSWSLLRSWIVEELIHTLKWTVILLSHTVILVFAGVTSRVILWFVESLPIDSLEHEVFKWAALAFFIFGIAAYFVLAGIRILRLLKPEFTDLMSSYDSPDSVGAVTVNGPSSLDHEGMTPSDDESD